VTGNASITGALTAASVAAGTVAASTSVSVPAMIAGASLSAPVITAVQSLTAPVVTVTTQLSAPTVKAANLTATNVLSGGSLAVAREGSIGSLSVHGSLNASRITATTSLVSQGSVTAGLTSLKDTTITGNLAVAGEQFHGVHAWRPHAPASYSSYAT